MFKFTKFSTVSTFDYDNLNIYFGCFSKYLEFKNTIRFGCNYSLIFGYNYLTNEIEY